MPKYVYHCKECGEDFTVKHSLKEVVEICHLCNSPTKPLRRPSTIFLNKKSGNIGSKVKVGSVVKETIESVREDLRIEQERLTKREYNNE